MNKVWEYEALMQGIGKNRADHGTYKTVSVANIGEFETMKGA